MDSRLVLLVEDDLTDANLIARAVQDATAPVGVVHVNDCEQALRYLRSRPERVPSLIMLALNLPGRSGFDFLKAIKADETWKAIPIVGLAESDGRCDVSEGFELGIAGYVVKSKDPAKLRGEIAMIREYWTLSRLPRITG
ncbi:MAG: response regulator [Phycisphaerales bacterium]